MRKRWNLCLLMLPLFPYTNMVSGQSTSFQQLIDFGNCDIGFFVYPTSDSGFVTSGRDDDRNFIMKHDVNGTVQWCTQIDFGLSQAYHCIDKTDDSGYIALGLVYLTSNRYYHLAKLNSNGNITWEKYYSTANPGLLPSHRSYLGLNGIGLEGMKVHQSSDGGFVLAGEIYDQPAGLSYYHVFKTDSLGDILWSYCYNSGPVVVSDMAISNASENPDWIVMSGTVYGDTNKVSLICVDESGNLVWSKDYTFREDNGGYSVKFTANNNIIVTGYTSDLNSYNVALSSDVLLFETDISGNVLFAKDYSFPNGSVEWGNDVQPTDAPGFLLCGTHANGSTNSNTDSTDAFLLKTDLIGNFQWANSYGDLSGTQEFISVTQGFDHSYSAIGYSHADIYIIKTDSSGVSGCDEQAITVTVTDLPFGIENNGAILSLAMLPVNLSFSEPVIYPTQFYSCSDLSGLNEVHKTGAAIYPNPANEYVTIQFNGNKEKRSIEILDMTGRIIRSINEIDEPFIDIDVCNFTAGIYSVRITSEMNSCILLMAHY